MVKDKRDKFANELDILCKKYSVTNWGFCGEIKNGFWGLTQGGLEATINIGRLWQYARERTKTFLDSFEGGRR